MNARLCLLLFLPLVFNQSFLCSHAARKSESPESEIIKDVHVLASDSLEGRGTGTTGELKASDYLAGRMKELRLAPGGGSEGWFQTFTFKPHPPVQMHHAGDSVTMGMALVKEISGRNVIGYLDMKAPSTVVIGAHYDHLGFGDENSLWTGERMIHNGADDNASGVACMLELARRIQAEPDAYGSNNYVFIAFSGEEKGLWGSNYFTKHPTVDTSTVNYMLNMDMVGRLNTGRTLAINGTGTSSYWADELPRIRAGNLKLVTTESGVGPSDHTSFYNCGIPALHFFTGQHEDYHKPSDDADKVNYEGIESVVDFIDQLIRRLDSRGTLPFSRTKDEKSPGAADFKVTLGVVPDYLFGGPGMRIDGTREGRPAEKAGLHKGDVVHRIGEFQVVDMVSYMEALSKFEKGQTTTIEVERDGKRMELTVIWD